MKMIRITSKQDGFRRCGGAHSGTGIYPADHWGPEDLARLKAEPMLVVDEIDVPDPAADGEKGAKGK